MVLSAPCHKAQTDGLDKNVFFSKPNLLIASSIQSTPVQSAFVCIQVLHKKQPLGIAPPDYKSHQATFLSNIKKVRRIGHIAMVKVRLTFYTNRDFNKSIDTSSIKKR